MSDISLTAGIRSSLVQLNQTAGQFDQTTSRLASGRKVNSAIDNPTNFFAAVNLNDRAAGLSQRLDGLGQAAQTIQAADNGISSVRSILSALTGVVNQALSTSDSSAREALGNTFNELINQVQTTAKDSQYQGTNLIQNDDAGETVTVQFNETFGESTLDVDGFDIAGDTGGASGVATGGLAVTSVDVTLAANGSDSSEATVAGASLVLRTQSDTGAAVGIQGFNASGQAGTGAAAGTVDWTDDNYQELLRNVVSQIEAFDAELRTQASNLATNLSTITTREEFTTDIINTLQEGADRLTLADLNEEGANLLALQTQNQLATQSLSLASQQSQSVLQLIG